MFIKNNYVKRTIANIITAKIMLVLACVTLMVTAVTANAMVKKDDPYQLIETVAKNTFARFANEEQAIKANPNLLKNIVREELMPYIDYRYAALKVIGKNYKKTTKAERAAFVPAFRDYLITSYAQVFTLYNHQKVKFFPGKDFQKKRNIPVNVQIIEPGRDPINISFRVRKDKKTKQWKAYDMVAEGISLLDSKRAEFASLIRQKGLTHVTEMLKKKSAKNITFKGEKKK